MLLQVTNKINWWEFSEYEEVVSKQLCMKSWLLSPEIPATFYSWRALKQVLSVRWSSETMQGLQASPFSEGFISVTSSNHSNYSTVYTVLHTDAAASSTTIIITASAILLYLYLPIRMLHLWCVYIQNLYTYMYVCVVHNMYECIYVCMYMYNYWFINAHV